LRTKDDLTTLESATPMMLCVDPSFPCYSS
jgi:hypothetical protein